MSYSSTSPFKPSPLTFPTSSSNSPRTSPFRRQNSTTSNSSSEPKPASSLETASTASTTASTPSYRPSTPSNATSAGATHTSANRPSTPSKLHAASTPGSNAATFSSHPLKSPTKAPSAFTPPGLQQQASPATSTPRTMIHHTPPPPAQTGLGSGSRSGSGSPSSKKKNTSSGYTRSDDTGSAAGIDSLSRLPPTLLHALRESFSVLDSSSSSSISFTDIKAIHTQLSLPPPASQSSYFPAKTPHPLPLAAYLGLLADPLSQLSPKEELLAALSAFDEDESGQIDVLELTKALGEGVDGEVMNSKEVAEVLAGFTGRRAFGSQGLNNKKKGEEVFRYREWVGGLGGGGVEGKVEGA